MAIACRHSRLSVIIASLLFAPAIWAQESESPRDIRTEDADSVDSQRVNTLDQIIVTAQKRSQSVNEVPMTVTALSVDTLNDLGVSSVADLAKVTPGLRYTQSSYSTPIYSIRGIGFNEMSLGAKPTVSVYVDEAPLPFGQLTPIASLDVERVEVLKGPQGTLFGQNSTGGAINYIAAKPTDTFSSGLDLGYGSFSAFEGSGFVSGPISGTLRGRVAMKVEQGGDWQRSYTRDDRLGSKDRFAARGMLEWTPSESLVVNLSLSGFKDKSDNQATQYAYFTPFKQNILEQYVPEALTYPLAPRDSRAADWSQDFRPRRDNSLLQATLRADYSLSDQLTLTSISAYSDYDDDNVVDPDGVTLEGNSQHARGFIRSFNQEFRLTGEAGESVRYVLGANYEDDTVFQSNMGYFADNSNAYALAVFGGAYRGVHDRSRQEIDSSAVFANVEFELNPSLTLHAGGRYTEYNIDFTGCTADPGDGVVGTLFTRYANYVRRLQGAGPIADIQPGACFTLDSSFSPVEVARDFKESNTSWRTGLDWTPSDGLLLYVNAGKGYKAGSFPLLPTSMDEQMTPVTQESVMAYEAGIKASLLDRTLQVNGALFYYDYQDKQIRARTKVPIFGQLERLINVPESKVKGAELQVYWRPMLGLTLNLGATYVDSEVTRGVAGIYDAFANPVELEGEQFPLTSKWEAFGDVLYEWELSSTLEAFIGGSIAYQGKSNGNFGSDSRFDIPDYTLLDLRAGLASPDGSWRAWIWGRNVTDEYYWTNADRIGDRSIRFAGQPATFGASVSLRW